MKALKFIVAILVATVFTACDKEEFFNVDGNDSDKDTEINVETSGAVDLGLTVKWAACDLGAKFPYVTGDNYWATYLYTNGVSNVSGSAKDPATSQIGDNWRTPTRQEVEELINDCHWKHAIFHKVNGWLVTGPSGKTIFIKCGSYLTATFDSHISFYLYCDDYETELRDNLYSSISGCIRPVQD